MDSNKRYAAIFKACADPTRLKILALLSEGGELCACQILESFDITQPSLSYHMKTLTDSGLVTAYKDGAWMQYRLSKDSILELAAHLSSLVEESPPSGNVAEPLQQNVS